MNQLNYLDKFIESLNILPDFLIYLALGISAFVENICPPIPGDTITVFGAFLVGTKRLHFFGVYLSSTLGSLFGFLFLFGLEDCWAGASLLKEITDFSRRKTSSGQRNGFKNTGTFLYCLTGFFRESGLPYVLRAVCPNCGLLRLSCSPL